MIDSYCKSKGIKWADINKPEYQGKVMKRYAFKDWDSVLATVGHGGLKEGQVVNKLVDEHNKDLKKQISDKTVLENIDGKASGNTKMIPEVQVKKSGNGIVVKGIHDLAVRFSKCCAPVPGDEIIGFVTRGRGISIHRTDCINILSLPEEERARLIPAEWQAPEGESAKYRTEIKIFSNNRVGLFVDISKVFTERGIDITAIKRAHQQAGHGDHHDVF